jgi:aspartate/methionine/tyrosine aminotransferase
MHPLATAANDIIQRESPAVFGLLSALGTRMYWPAKGILSQSAEAAKAKVNASIGIATNGSTPLYLPCVHKYFQGLDSKDLYAYAPSPGRKSLRDAWLAKMRRQNPSIGTQAISLPVVTNALTHGLSLLGDLFLNPGDVVLTSDLHWENYELCWQERIGATVSTWPLFDTALKGMDLAALEKALAAHRGRKVMLALNFPNNPSGYSPTKTEAQAIAQILGRAAEAGTRIIAVCDDAYYGMAYETECWNESLFGLLCGLHSNLLAIRLDGATKEEFVWGLRVGFITYGVKGGTPALYQALEDKTAGLIRATISNVSHPGQTIVEKALADPAFAQEQTATIAVLAERYRAVRIAATRSEYADLWQVYPFNSGYFMCLKIKGVEADTLRKHLIANHNLGTIALGPTDLRVAFSCVRQEDIEGVFVAIAQGIRQLRG